MTDKLYSVKEIADQCGVTKQTIFNYMDEVFRVKHTHKVGNRQMIDEAGMTELVAHFVKSESSNVKGEIDKDHQSSNGLDDPASKPRQTNDQDNNMSTTAEEAADAQKEIEIAILQTQLQGKNDVIAQLRAQIRAQDEQIKRSDQAMATKDEQIAQLHKLMDQNQQLLLAEQRQSNGLIQGTDEAPAAEATSPGEKKSAPAINEETEKKSWFSKFFK